MNAKDEYAKLVSNFQLAPWRNARHPEASWAKCTKRSALPWTRRNASGRGYRPLLSWATNAPDIAAGGRLHSAWWWDPNYRHRWNLAKSSQIWYWGNLAASGPTKQIVFWIWRVCSRIWWQDLPRANASGRSFRGPWNPSRQACGQQQAGIKGSGNLDPLMHWRLTPHLLATTRPHVLLVSSGRWPVTLKTPMRTDLCVPCLPTYKLCIHIRCHVKQRILHAMCTKV